MSLVLFYGIYMSQLIDFASVSSQVSDFNDRNKFLTATLLKQRYWYHKLHIIETISKKCPNHIISQQMTPLERANKATTDMQQKNEQQSNQFSLRHCGDQNPGQDPPNTTLISTKSKINRNKQHKAPQRTAIIRTAAIEQSVVITTKSFKTVLLEPNLHS